MSEVLVKTVEGKLRGKVNENYAGEKFFSFLGVPYAEAPVGELRFKAPQKLKKWEGIRDARKEGYECPSKHMITQFYVGYEDNCLNLNVFTKNIPQTEFAELKPVMVFIHGGAYVYGSNKVEFYGSDFFMNEDIVLVVINYRLGVLGFLSLEDESLDIPGNAGMKDQVMALQWVQSNIKHFGGNPENVTVFGQSAGAASVHLLMLSPMTKGLFHKAILQSGTALNVWGKGLPNGKIIAEILGYKEMNERSILEKLRKQPVRQLLEAQYSYKDDTSFDTHRPFGPVIEKPSPDAFITEDPVDIIKSGKYHKIPFIIGYTNNEGILFDMVRKIDPKVNIFTDFKSVVPLDLNINDNPKKKQEIANKLRQYYFKDKLPSEENIKEVFAVKGDIGFKYHINKAIELHSQTNEKPIYFYVFSHDGPLNIAKNFGLTKLKLTSNIILMFAALTANIYSINSVFQFLFKMVPKKIIQGASHCDELSYMFRQNIHPEIVPGSKNECFIKRMVKLWTNFAKHGHPTPGADDLFDEIIWTPVREDHLINLDINYNLSLNSYPDAEMVKFLDEIYESVKQ